MFLSIIDGTASAKDAFKQLAVVVIQEMQRILAVRMAAGIIRNDVRHGPRNWYFYA